MCSKAWALTSTLSASPSKKEVGTGPDQKMIGNIPYTPRVKKVLALASKEAKALNHTYVGTEHIFVKVMAWRRRCEKSRRGY